MTKIISNIIIEIAGKPVENVEKALNVVLNKLKEEKEKFKLINSEIAEPELDKKTTLYHSFIDAEIKFNSTKEIMNFIIDYTPTSIEITEPEKTTLSSQELTTLLNDISNILLSSQNNIRKLNAHIHYLNKKYNINTKK